VQSNFPESYLLEIEYIQKYLGFPSFTVMYYVAGHICAVCCSMHTRQNGVKSHLLRERNMIAISEISITLILQIKLSIIWEGYMSRNKFILIIIILAGLYFILPDGGIYHVIKINTVAVLPYILVCLIIYLVFTINLLKHAWKKLDSQLTDENVINFSKLLNISFDVVRILGAGNLIALYNKVNFSTKVSPNSKQLLYEAMRRKRLDVALPWTKVSTAESLE